MQFEHEEEGMDEHELLSEIREEWGQLDLECRCGGEVPQFGDTSCPVCKINALLCIYEDRIGHEV